MSTHASTLASTQAGAIKSSASLNYKTLEKECNIGPICFNDKAPLRFTWSPTQRARAVGGSSGRLAAVSSARAVAVVRFARDPSDRQRIMDSARQQTHVRGLWILPDHKLTTRRPPTRRPQALPSETPVDLSGRPTVANKTALKANLVMESDFLQKRA